MHRLVLSPLIRGIVSGLKCNNIYRTCHITRSFGLYLSKSTQIYTLPTCGHKVRSERKNYFQTPLNISSTCTYVTGRNDELHHNRKPRARRGEDSYELYEDELNARKTEFHNTQKYDKDDFDQEEFSLSSQNQAEPGDNFGDLSKDLNMEPYWLQDENFDAPLDHEKPHRRLSVEDRRHPQEWYFDQIVAMGKEGKVLKAIAVLDDWMLVRDRVMPNEDIFTAVIGIIGRTGNVKLAFKYFKKMRNYGLRPNDATFTALFNACANCPDKIKAQKKGYFLRKYMHQLEIIPQMITYNAIIKMYARLGDLPNAFLVADEAMSNRRAADKFFIGSLLSAAISDKEEGLLYAIEVWRRMKIMRIKPDIFHYKLLLHAIRDCKLGSEEQQRILLQPWMSHKKLTIKHQQTTSMTEVEQKQICSQHLKQGHYSDVNEEQSQMYKFNVQRKNNHEEPPQNLQTDPDTVSLSPQSSHTVVPLHERSSTVAKFPDLLEPKENFSEVVSLGDMTDIEDRLMLMGGVSGFLRRMAVDNIKPDITVLTWLVEMMRGKEDEEIILAALEDGHTKADSTFLNALIRKKSKESYDEAKAVLKLFSKYNVVPNKQTYGSLLFCTRAPKDCMEILHSMENAGLVPDIKTFGLLIGNAPRAFHYKKRLIEKMERLNIKPDLHFLKTIDRHLEYIRNQILAEKRKYRTNTSFVLEEELEDFNKFYKEWLHRTEMAKERHQLENYRLKKPLVK
ncbi:pentatricopeptide repeat-containing protein 1, mitochondrial-like [Argopecten irradians]|uniref:pentatricopeptide repeat-containing protein 1, mitochondrial-like n=1 Tax=Argopecten irradians TaxID=31199 RepID=UPI00371EC997